MRMTFLPDTKMTIDSLTLTTLDILQSEDMILQKASGNKQKVVLIACILYEKMNYYRLLKDV